MAHVFLNPAYEEPDPPTPRQTPIRIWRADTLHRRRPPGWLVAGVLPHKSLGCIYGEPDVGKTLTVLYLALAIANGLSVLGGRAVRQGPVLFIVGEGEEWFRFRLDAWVKKHPNVKNPLAHFYVVLHPVDLLDDAEVEKLITSIQLMFPRKQPILIVVDTLTACFGEGNENATEDMNHAVASLKRLRRAFRCTVLVIHHPGKDVSKGPRGASSLRGALDTQLFLRRPKAKEPYVELVCKKLKDGAEKFPSITLELVGPIDLGVTDDSGTPITSAMVRYPGPRKQPLEERFAIEHRFETLARLVKLGTATNGQLVKTEDNPKGIPHDSLAKALHFLTTDGYAEKRGKLYIPTPQGKKTLKRLRAGAE